MRILISFCVAAVMTYGSYLWWKRQVQAEGRQQSAGWLSWLLALLYIGVTVLTTLLVWAGFMEPVRSLDSYPFIRLGLSLWVGLLWVAVGALMGALFAFVHGNEQAPRKSVWRRLNPIGCQFIFVMFSGLAFQHSFWGGPP